MYGRQCDGKERFPLKVAVRDKAWTCRTFWNAVGLSLFFPLSSPFIRFFTLNPTSKEGTVYYYNKRNCKVKPINQNK